MAETWHDGRDGCMTSRPSATIPKADFSSPVREPKRQCSVRRGGTCFAASPTDALATEKRSSRPMGHTPTQRIRIGRMQSGWRPAHHHLSMPTSHARLAGPLTLNLSWPEHLELVPLWSKWSCRAYMLSPPTPRWGCQMFVPASEATVPS